MNTTIIRVIVIWTVITIGGLKGIDTMCTYGQAVSSDYVGYLSTVNTDGDTEYETYWLSKEDNGVLYWSSANGQTFQRAVQIGRNVLTRVANMKAILQ